MISIKTGCWFTPVPRDHIRIGISRGTPRGLSGYRNFRTLAPGPWFNSIPPGEYITKYEQILGALDPVETVSKIEALAGEKIAVLCCFETIAAIKAGTWCHRHLAAAWLEDRLDIEIPELGAGPAFDPLAFWEKRGIALPWSRSV